MEREERKSKRYKQLFRMPLTENRFLVISRGINNKIYMSQQVKIKEKNGTTSYPFLKNVLIFQSDEDFEVFRKGVKEINLKGEK